MILTNWGYTLTDVDELPSMLSVDEFNEFTADKYKGDTRIKAEITAAESAIRNYVGWHLSGPLSCAYDGDSEDVARIIQLPSMYVTAVDALKINGADIEKDSYEWKPNGLIRLKYRTTRNEWNDIHVEYTAGLPAANMGAVKEIIANRVTHGLANSYGVTSEASGGVSVTYSSNWASYADAASIPETEKEVLAPYRLRRVF